MRNDISYLIIKSQLNRDFILMDSIVFHKSAPNSRLIALRFKKFSTYNTLNFLKMKNLFFLILAASIYPSCSKDPDSGSTIPTVADGTVQYKVNGNLVTMRSDNIANAEYVKIYKQLAGTANSHTRYIFQGQNGVNNALGFDIYSDSLTTRNYTYDSTSRFIYNYVLIYNGEISGLLMSGDNMNINITSYSNGYISRNFTAKFSPVEANFNYSKRGTTLITEGAFKNIKCIY